MAFSLQARVVYPVDQPPIERGVVTILGERIVAVGTAKDGGDVHDLGDVALLPGLVNAHTHLEFSYLRWPLGQPGMRLEDWIRLVIAQRGRGDIAPTVSIISGLRESLQFGSTTLCEIATSQVPVAFWGEYDVTIAAEVIGFSRARAASTLSATIERLNRMRDSEGGYGVTLGHGMRFGISPHAPYTVSPELLRELIDLAGVRKLPVAMHLAESADELEFLSAGTGPLQELLDERSMWDVEAIPRGTRLLDYLRMLSEAPRALVIHGNYLEADERQFLAEHVERMSLVFCPRTHAYFGHAPYPLAESLAAGVRVALGTDSRASNPDLSLLEEMRCVARTHAAIAPRDVLRMGTLSGAEALGRAEDTGSLTPGKLANLVAVPLPTTVTRSADELLAAVLADGAPVSAVWARGRVVAEPQAASG